MPKKPSPALIVKWRELRAEGNSFNEIGKETGNWQGRTVKKYVGQDLASREGKGVRLELFKERLGQHWDLVLNQVLGDLESIKVPGPGEALAWLCSEEAFAKPIAGALVQSETAGGITVNVHQSSEICWMLLGEHLPNDPIWEAAKAWEAALAADLNARRKLRGAVSQYLAEPTRLPVAERPTDSPALMLRGVHMLVEEILAQIQGVSAGKFSEASMEVTASGEVRAGGVTIALASSQEDSLALLVRKAANDEEQFPERASAKESYSNLKESTERLLRMVEFLRLLPYLPGDCTVCRRVEPGI